MKIYPIHISNFKIDGGAMFGVVPKVLWNRVYPSDENNLCSWALRSLLIDTGERVILVDNGYGDKQDSKFFSHVHLYDGNGLEGGLNKAGYKFGDITDIVLTHLHADHCGGGVKRNSNGSGFELTFPNAIYWVSPTQWELAVNPNIREADAFLEENLLPMMDSGHLKFIDEEKVLYPGFSLRIVNGHTPGQIIPVVDYKDTKLVYTADLIPSTAHIPMVWNMSYDTNPLITMDEKRSILEECLANNFILFFQHDLYTECCTLHQTPKGIRADKKFNFSDISNYLHSSKQGLQQV
jgi:glyoxylase-like metal-dependent hydrolase (beta-lactamase superfamily II)